MTTFWPWFFSGVGNAPAGFRSLLSRWLTLDAIIALFCIGFLKSNAFEFAAKALFPAASILVSMAIAWSNRASTVLQSEEFRNSVIGESNPVEDYLYGFQLSMAVMIGTVVYVAVMAAGGLKFFIYDPVISQNVSGFFMYALLSMSVRECWGVMNFSSLLSLLQIRVSNK
jgi:hypothetical protein